MDAVHALTTRTSPLQLGEPAPDEAALDAMLRAAVRAPDHGRLRPWRFILISGAARQRLGDVLADALHRRDPNLPDQALSKERGKPLRAPLVIVVAAKLREHPGVPAIEQTISAGAAAQNILVAAHALGFGAFWRTGAAAYDDSVKTALGLHREDDVVGFLYVGTPVVAAPPPSMLDPSEFAIRWTGPLDAPASDP